MTRWPALALLLCACTGMREKGVRWVELDKAPAGDGRRFALVIGVGEFEDERFPALKYATRDAEAVSDALEGFERVVRLTGEQTRRPTVLAALEGLLREASAPQDTVVVYVSSHGSLAQRPGGGLERVIVTRDARMDVLLATGIPIDELTRRLEQSRARRRLVVLALCHSGKGKSQLPDSLARTLALQKAPPRLETVSEATIVLTACAFGETARESDELEHDVYTHFLLEALKAGDADGDGAVTATEAHDFARERTFLTTQGQQRPTSESEVLGIDPIVLRGKRTALPRPVVFSYARSAEGLEVKVDGRSKGVLPGSVALDPGEVQLELKDGARTLFAGRITLEAGERRDLSQVLPRPATLEAGLGPWVQVPLSASFREQVVPASAGVQLRATSHRFAAQWLLLELQLGYAFGAGSTQGIGATLSTRAHSVATLAGLGARVPVAEALVLDVLALGGAWWLRREISAPGFEAADAAVAPTVALKARGTYHAGPVGVALGLDGRLSGVRLDGALRPEPVLSLALELVWPAPR